MNPYLTAVMQCYAKSATYLKTDVLPNVTDPQTKQGIEFCIAHAEQQAKNLQELPDDFASS